jgi:hypothetical protein
VLVWRVAARVSFRFRVSGRVGLVWFQDGAVQRATGNDAVYDERSDMAERTGEQCIA